MSLQDGSLRDSARELNPDLVSLRRKLHTQPEVGLELPRTQEKVLGELDGLPLEISTGSGLSSVTAVLRGAGSGAPVLLRGDMDALPVTERTDLPFAAREERMHACGHDLHTSMLVGAAQLLCERRAELAGDVVFMFQPGEEGWDGAGHMITEGVLEAAGARPTAAYGLHVTSSLLPSGMFASRGGTLMSGSDRLRVTVHGVGGHGAQPQRARDPVPAACEMVTALQTAITRRVDVFDPAVLTVGSFHAGTQANVIPDSAAFEATVRSFSTETRARLHDLAVSVCEGVAGAHGVRVEVAYEAEYGVTVNDGAETGFAESVTREVFDEGRFQRLPNPMTPSEDFSRVLDRVPGSFVFLGATPPDADPASAPNNHSPLARFDDSVLGDGAGLLAELAWRRLARAAA